MGSPRFNRVQVLLLLLLSFFFNIVKFVRPFIWPTVDHMVIKGSSIVRLLKEAYVWNVPLNMCYGFQLRYEVVMRTLNKPNEFYESEHESGGGRGRGREGRGEFKKKKKQKRRVLT